MRRRSHLRRTSIPTMMGAASWGATIITSLMTLSPNLSGTRTSPLNSIRSPTASTIGYSCFSLPCRPKCLTHSSSIAEYSAQVSNITSISFPLMLIIPIATVCPFFCSLFLCIFLLILSRSTSLSFSADTTAENFEY